MSFRPFCTSYESDADAFPSGTAYRVKEYPGVAWRACGWQTAPNEDGEPERTGKVVARMIGDDRLFAFDRDDLTALEDLAYCEVCGQCGCHEDGRDRG